MGLIDEDIFNDPDLYNLKGCCYKGLKKFSQAIENFDIAIYKSDYPSTFYWNKIDALQKIGRDRDIDKTLILLATSSSNTIKKEPNSYSAMKAYIARAYTQHPISKLKEDAKKALKIYEHLPIEEQDLHDYDEIINLQQML